MKVVFVVGPTASGKSHWALEKAELEKSAIVNCDSVQLYQGLFIGSASPTLDEKKRVPHYLFNYIAKGETATVGSYVRDFFTAVEEIKNKFNTIYVVGGTGFYFQALENGLYPVSAVNEKIKKELEERLLEENGEENLYTELKTLDPEVAKKISSHDHYRLVRFLEIIKSEGKTISAIQDAFKGEKKQFPFPLEKVGFFPNREELIPKIKIRTEKMIKEGLIDEVKGLIQDGLEDWSPLSSIGYKETLSYLKSNEEIKTIEELKAKIILNTLKLAKKQKTWFKRDKSILWLNTQP